MKRVIRCSEDHSAMIIPSILDEFGKNEPGTGCTFIADDGTFVNIYPELDIHEDLCDWVEDNFDIKLKYKDEEYFVREYGWIRLRKDPNMCVVELPNERPTNAEWYSLEEWLEWVEEITSGREISLYINILDTQIYSVEVAFGKEMFTDGLLKMLKGYYTSHRLIASKGVNMKRVVKASFDKYAIGGYTKQVINALVKHNEQMKSLREFQRRLEQFGIDDLDNDELTEAYNMYNDILTSTEG